MKTILFLSSSHLGDTIQAIPVLRQLNNEGNRIIVFMFKYLIPAFEKIPWLEIIPITKNDLEYSTNQNESLIYNEVNKLEKIILSHIALFKNFQFISHIPFSDALRNSLSFVVNDFKNPINKQYDVPSNAFALSAGLGLQVKDYKLELGFELKNIELKGEINIGVSLGSLWTERRLTRSNIDDILLLKDKYSFYFMGIGTNKIEEVIEKNCVSLINQNRLTGLNSTLNYLSQMRILITPDSGLMHCALAMKIPVILLTLGKKSGRIEDKLVHPFYVPFISVCDNLKNLDDMIRGLLTLRPKW